MNLQILYKAIPLQAWNGPEGCRNLRFPDFMTTAQDGGKVVSLTHRPPLPPGNTPGTHFCYRLSRPQGHSATGKILSMKNSNDTSWDRTSDLPICSTTPRYRFHIMTTNFLFSCGIAVFSNGLNFLVIMPQSRSALMILMTPVNMIRDMNNFQIHIILHLGSERSPSSFNKAVFKDLRLLLW